MDISRVKKFFNKFFKKFLKKDSSHVSERRGQGNPEPGLSEVSQANMTTVKNATVQDPKIQDSNAQDPKVQDFLRVLRDPTDAQIDIVAVHGLNPTNTDFHAEMTWTAPNGKMWLKDEDFLPATLPTARVLLFGYNANVAFGTSIAGIQEQAENLLNRLALKRRSLAERPIIFVCHSLGGLVVKRALVTAKQTIRYSDIKNATYSIAFFGTPHRGGNNVPLGNIAASIARMALHNPTNTFMEALKKDNLFAKQFVEDFKQQLEDYYILSFFETQPYKTLGLIVDQESATLGLPLDREIRISLAGDHKDICKFESSDSDNYELVRGNIEEHASNAIKAVKEKVRLAALGTPIEQLSLIPVENLKKMSHAVDRVVSQLDDRESQIILNWLSKITYDSRHEESILKFQKGTGQRIFNSWKYKHWLRNNGQTLFCHGIPGAGKTIITSVVIKELHSRQDPSIGVAYFYFTYDQQRHEQEPQEALKCLLKQLCERRVPIPDAVKSFYNKHEKLTPASIDEIMETFQAVANLYRKKFIIIDALDECQASSGHRMKFIQWIKEFQKRTGANIFMTSRIIPEVVAEFINSPRLEIRASRDDVQVFLDKEIPQLRFQGLLKGEAELEEEIKTKICEISNGMFLLARLLLNLLDGATNKEEIRQYLQGVSAAPDAYGEIYKNLIIHRIEKQEETRSSLAKRTLAWIVCAMEPLDTSALRHALAVQPKDRELNEDRVTELDTIISVCCGLVIVEGQSGIIRLVHLTAQEYFKQSRGDWFQSANANISATCVAYLSFPTDNLPGYIRKEFHPRKSDSFYKYASINWGHHAREALVLDQSIVEFLQNKEALISSIQAIVARNKRKFNSPWLTTGIHLAAYFGLEKAIRALLSDTPYLELRGTQNQTPLSYAAENGHNTVVQLLLTINKVDPDSKSAGGETPLMRAAKNGHDATVKLLLATNKVDINLKGPDGTTALMLAAENGHDAAVKLLLATNKVDINLKGPDGITALMLAAENGLDAIELLLTINGIDVNSKDGNGQTPLQMAVRRGRGKAVQALLGSGTLDANLGDNQGRTPLWHAVYYRHKEIVELLLKSSKVNANLANQNGKTPLFVAITREDTTMVQVLLASRKINVNLMGKYDPTPLQWAERWGSAERGQAIIKLLRAAGAVDIPITT